MAEPRWLTPAEMRAWRGYRRMRTLLDLQITRDLAADSGLSDADYDVLSSVSEAPGRRMRIGELAAGMLWSVGYRSMRCTHPPPAAAMLVRGSLSRTASQARRG